MTENAPERDRNAPETDETVTATATAGAHVDPRPDDTTARPVADENENDAQDATDGPETDERNEDDR